MKERMRIVALKDIRPTDTLACDVVGPNQQLLCAKGVLLRPEVVKRLERYGIESLQIMSRETELKTPTEGEQARIREEVEQRFSRVGDDRFMTELKGVTTRVLLDRRDEEDN
jgi:hypothetical protein